jgi:DNA-binding response OmpR family regulator
MLTAKTEPADLLAAIEAGADDYVSKPLNSTELRTRLTLGCRRVESLSSREYPEETYQSAIYAEWG